MATAAGVEVVVLAVVVVIQVLEVAVPLLEMVTLCPPGYLCLLCFIGINLKWKIFDENSTRCPIKLRRSDTKSVRVSEADLPRRYPPLPTAYLLLIYIYEKVKVRKSDCGNWRDTRHRCIVILGTKYCYTITVYT